MEKITSESGKHFAIWNAEGIENYYVMLRSLAFLWFVGCLI
jgi:hypothetical protein